MQKQPITNILKSRPKRTVYRELDAIHGEGTFIVKRFHAPGWIQGWRDGIRAHREAQGLRRWRSLGFSAPEPIEVRRRAGHWELVMAAIPGASPLPEFLESTRGERGRSRRLARALGTLLARLDESGFHQGDPHPGNLLVDHEDHLWLIDPTPQPLFSGRAAPGRARWLRFCAQLRESSSPLFRARVARAYVQAAGPYAPPQTEVERHSMECAAREWRFQEGRKRTGRWLRDSGATQVEGSSIHSLTPSQGRNRSQCFGSPGEARSAWLIHGRLHEHRIPCVAAKALHLASSTLESVLPHGARTLDLTRDRDRVARFLGQLHDRGFPLTEFSAQDLWVDADGIVIADPRPWQFQAKAATAWSTPQLPDWIPGLTPEFVEAFLAPLGNTRQQVQALRRTLLEG